MKKILLTLIALGLPLNALATTGQWTSAQTINTIYQDDCGGGASASATVFMFTGSPNTLYYFMTNVQSSSTWLSLLQTALATGLKVNLMAETSTTSPSGCNSLSGYQVHLVQMNP